MDKNKRKQRGQIKEQVVFPIAESLTYLPDDYQKFISDIKNRINISRLTQIIKVNSSMILLYWDIGNSILQKQADLGWGAKVIDRMSYDHKQEFSDMSGFSPRNLKYMKKFAEVYTDIEIVQRTIALIPWRSNLALFD